MTVADLPSDNRADDDGAAYDAPANAGEGKAARGLRAIWPSRWRWRIAVSVLFIAALVLTTAWLGRERIAQNVIDDGLAQYGLEARYDIVSIGPAEQVIANLEVGPAGAPDFTARQIVIDIDYPFGVPGIGGIALDQPRLYGQIKDGRVSFGSLDQVLSSQGEGAGGLPAIDLDIDDGRALIDSLYGAVGIKLAGSGRLDDGFAGILAATAPGFGLDDETPGQDGAAPRQGAGLCKAQTATLYGAISSADGRLQFDGPARLGQVQCAGVTLAKADIAARLFVSEDFLVVDGDLGLDAAQMSYGGSDIARLGGTGKFLWRFGGGNGRVVDFDHDFTANDLRSEYGDVGAINAKGSLRVTDDLKRTEWGAIITGSQMTIGLTAMQPLRDFAAGGEGLFLAELAQRFDSGLTTALAGGEAVADVTLRRDDDGVRVNIPQARLRNGAGEDVLALSRVNYARSYADADSGGDGVDLDQLSGNIRTGGADLPTITGRMEQGAGEGRVFRLSMDEYRAGQSSLEIPRMDVRQDARGRITFAGDLRAGGPVPGGTISALDLPIDGNWSGAAGLELGRRCANVRIGALEYGQTTLADQAITLCPDAGGAMLRYRERLEVAAIGEGVDIAAMMGDSPARLTAQRMELRYPGPFALTGLETQIGEAGDTARLAIESITGEAGSAGDAAQMLGGRFSGGVAALGPVPLDMTDMTGAWQFTDGALRISEGAFILSDPPDQAFEGRARFEPLLANNATLVLADGVIRAQSDLMHPQSGALISAVTIEHDLDQGAGRADLAVPGIEFTRALQPVDLSLLMGGYIADASGSIAGNGEITWRGEEIESSGTFGSEDFSFAAVFGPVEGVRGEVTFTDLLALTTAPSQVIEVGSINPGVEVLGGRIVFAVEDRTRVTLEDARWPFMGGELILQPATLDYGGGYGQNYVFEIVGLDAASFVAQMELTNFDAAGTFDGTIPVFFDAQGNGSINGGLLIARQPGGNIAYIGELVYEDMGEMANFAFQSLRSLDFRQMSVELNGELAGEIITKFQFDGVSQGEGATENFITRRLARLPIRFNINVRSDSFSQLATVVRGYSDPTVFDNDAIRRALGLGGTAVAPPEPTPTPTTTPSQAQDAPKPLEPPDDPDLRGDPGDAQRRPEPEPQDPDLQDNEPSVQPPESD
ncbi:MAG: YdbH domain-containing protein [Pseudomonadota bacterium]